MSRRLILAMLLALLVPSIISAGGGKETPAEGTISATDAMGRSVSLSTEPSRILITGKSAVVISDALMLFDDADQLLVELPKTDQGTGDLYSILMPSLASKSRTPELTSLEEVAARQPDLVMMKDFSFSSNGDRLVQMGFPVFTASLEMPENWTDEILQIGKIIGQEERAKQVTALYGQRIEAVEQQVSTIAESQRPRVLMMRVSYSSGALNYTVAPDSWMQTRLITDAGGIPVWLGSGFASKGFAKISFEQIAAWNPDYIFVYSYKEPATEFLSQLKTDSRWQQITAMREGHVLAIPGDYASYAQPVSRWILALQWMAATLHPTLFPMFDMEQEIANFYNEFHHLQDPNAIQMILEQYQASAKEN